MERKSFRVLNCLLLFFLFVGIEVGAQGPTYTVVAPAKVRPNSQYHVNLQLLNANKPTTFDVELSGRSAANGTDYRITKSIVVDSSESSVLALDIGQWTEGTYNLRVKGKSEEMEQFIEEKSLQFEPKSFSIFIQTDKAIYKPGQTVQFRVIVVNADLLLNVQGALDVYLKDSKDNLIKQWKGFSLSNGILSGELKLSEQPPLGDWSIHVELRGIKHTKTFTVAEYVLPTFSVDITLPPYVTYTRPDMVANVKATYTYGRPVKGDVTLSYRLNNNQLQSKKLQTKLGIDGSVDIPVNFLRDFNLRAENYDQEMEFTAEVEETLTGRKYNKSAVLKIYYNEFKVELIKLSNTFKPGLKYTAFLKVAYMDDKPVEDNGPMISLMYGYTHFAADWTHVLELQPVKGLARIDLMTPKANLPLGWKAEYRGHVYNLEAVESAYSPSNSYIQMVSKSGQNHLEDLFGAKAALAGEEVTYQITSTGPIKEIAYKILSKGNIVQTRTVSAADPKATTMDFTIKVTPDMAPKARLVAYYVREDNREVVADSLSFRVEGGIKTPVVVTSNVNETKPGGQVNLQIKTSPSAYVGLLGVDQSVLLLKSGNDITHDDVLQELETYDTGKASPVNFGWSGMWRYRPIYGSGASSAAEIFDDAGLIILTNGVVYRKEGTNVNNFPGPMPPVMFDKAASGSREHSTGGQREHIQLRQKFPETWIWANVSAGPDGIAKYSDTIPDTITSWFISAFAVDANTGLGVVEDSLKIKVFRPFFIQLSLPYSIIRGESVALKVLVFNYQDKAAQAEVVMENLKEEFDFANSKEARKITTIPAFDGVTLNFVITPKKLGPIDIKVRAVAGNAGDAIVQKLLVKPEGQTQYFNKALFVKLDKSHEKVQKHFSIEVPANIVPDSLKMRVTGISDVLGPTLNNIDNLLRMPYGCGEQNMINLVPNIVVLNYLTKANRLTPAIRSKAVSLIETGYQRELTYRRQDGSFSAFGNSDKNGSTWLTAFVVKSFIQARPYLDVDQAVITQGVMFLLSRQQADGSFVEYGEVHHKDLQGGAGDADGALTAYVLLAIVEDFKSAKVPSAQSEAAINKAATFLAYRLAISSKPYEIAMIANALQLADSQHKEVAFSKLMSLAQRDDSGLMHWTGKPEAPTEATKPMSEYLQLPNSLDVETSAYSLLTLVARKDTDNSIPILRWLISKQNSNGGFSSTQDTIIGLTALGAIAEQLTQTQLAMTVTINHGNAITKSEKPDLIQFNPENALVLQQIDFEPKTEWVDIEATGSGTAIVQVSYQYNIATAAEKPAFSLEITQDNTVFGENLKLDICTSYTDGDATNMALMEVELPSGYVADIEALRALARAPEVKRIDVSNNDETVYIYFDRVTRVKQCISVPAYRAHKVANHKPVPVTIYDYYNRSKLSRVFYEPTAVSLKDIIDPVAA